MTRTDSGFSLAECVVAMGLTMVVGGAAFAVANTSIAMGQAQPDAIDMQARLRTAHDALFRTILRAGAGMTTSSAAGPLIWTIAPIVPRRIGTQNPDPDVSARADAVTLMYVPQTVAQSATSGPVSVASGLEVQARSNCPAGRAMCGFEAGMTALVFDATAHFDLFSILRVQGATAQLRGHGAGSGYPYVAGAAVTEVESHTFYFDRAAGQLRQYDGDQTDVPIADNIAGVSFEYFGDPHPPVEPRPPAGSANCLYDVAGNALPMPTLSGAVGGLTPLPLAMFTDGPWCGGGATRFDVDLLRVRQLRVSLRVQAASARSRPADLTTTFVVSPRNLRGSQ